MEHVMEEPIFVTKNVLLDGEVTRIKGYTDRIHFSCNVAYNYSHMYC
jgi:hypothetical protein